MNQPLNAAAAPYRAKRVLVTGGLGFLGSSLAQALVPAGARVTLYDALLPLYGGNLFNVDGIRDRVDIVTDDIRNTSAVDRAVAGVDVVFHIAAQTSHIDSMSDPLLDVDINCRGTIQLLESCRRLAPQCKFVYVGTRAQYGRMGTGAIREDHPQEPMDIYGVNKAAAERYAFLYARAHGLAVTSLRVGNGYGPRHQMKHNRYGVLNWFIRVAMEGRPITVFGEGSQRREYVYVDDITHALLLAGASDAANGEAFNVSSGDPVAFRDMAEAIVRAVGSGSVERVPWPPDRKSIEVGDALMDSAHISRTLGWRPDVALEEGIARSVAFYRAHAEQYWAASRP